MRFSLPVNDHIQGGARDEQNGQDQRDDFDVDHPHLAADGAQTDDEKMAMVTLKGIPMRQQMDLVTIKKMVSLTSTGL